MTPPTRIDFAFLLLDGFSNMVLASAMEPLRAANDLTPDHEIAWQIASLDGKPVVSSSGLRLHPDIALDDLTRCSALFVISGYGARHHSARATSARIVRASRKTRLLGALDSGSWLLARAGLLDGYAATLHWQDISAFKEAFLDVDVRTDRFVIDRQRATAGGATAVMDLMLHLIRQQVSEAVAFDVVNLFVYDVERSKFRGRGARDPGLVTRAPRLSKAIERMRDTVGDPEPLPRIASWAAVSPRTLERLFQRELGMSPARYYLVTRLHHARNLVEETDFSTTDIAVRTGFSSISAFSRAFKAHFGQTARSMRAARLDRTA